MTERDIIYSQTPQVVIWDEYQTKDRIWLYIHTNVLSVIESVWHYRATSGRQGKALETEI